VTVDTDPTPMAWIDWQAAAAALNAGGLPCSGGQAGILRIAASIAEGIPVDLCQALTGLDQTSIHLTAQTVRRVGGQHQTAAWTGQVRA
jgi:hypothetical protein